MTEAQLNTRRENAKCSTGPRTGAGKKRSSLNAFRHGLTGQIVVHTAEDQQAFNKHCDGIRKDLDPKGALESNLAQAIAEGYWRLNRVRALENGIFALGQTEHLPQGSDTPELDAALAPARTWMAHAHELHLLALYESRISRSVEKNMAQIRTLQAQRKPATAQLPPEPFVTLELVGPDEEPFGDPPPGDPSPANPDSSVCFFKSGDPASNQPEPAPLSKLASRQEPPQQTAQRPEPPNNPPEPTRQPTMEDVYDIIGWHPDGEWVRNPIGQLVPRRRGPDSDF